MLKSGDGISIPREFITIEYIKNIILEIIPTPIEANEPDAKNLIDTSFVEFI